MSAFAQLDTARARLGWGVVVSLLDQGVKALYALGLVPLLVMAWGAEGYGRWTTLTALISFLAFVDLGGQNYFANLMALAHARHDDREFSRALSLGVSLLGAQGVLCFVLWSVVLGWGAIAPLPIVGRTLDPSELVILLALGAQTLLVAIPGGVYTAVYRSTGQFVRGGTIGNAVRFVGFFVCCALLLIGATPVVFALVLLSIHALSLLLIVIDTRRCIPACRSMRIGYQEARDALPHLGSTLAFFSLAVAQTVAQQGTLLVVATVVSPLAVALLAAHRALASVAGYVGVLLQGPILPELSFLWGQQRYDAFRAAAQRGARVTLWTTSMVAIVLWLLGPLVFPFVGHDRLALDSLLWGLVLLQGVASSAWGSSAWALYATNQHQRLASWTIVVSCVTVALSYVGALHSGVHGAAGALLAGDLALALVIVPGLSSTLVQSVSFSSPRMDEVPA